VQVTAGQSAGDLGEVEPIRLEAAFPLDDVQLGPALG
jgi:hypothetical protein